MKSIAEIETNTRINIQVKSMDGFSGVISMPGWMGTVVCSNGAGWEHVSVSPLKARIIPTWDDMCKIKDMFWSDDEAVIQIHPVKDQYVNNKPNWLHLWRCTYKEMVLPPSVLVGVRKGQSEAEVIREIKEAYALAGEVYK